LNPHTGEVFDDYSEDGKMVWQRGDAEVREWMREHPEEVERVRRRYEELSKHRFAELARLAERLGVDTSRMKEKLIAEIIRREGKI